MDLSNSIFNFSDKLSDDLERTADLKAGINRLLYPQKYFHKGIVQVEEDSFILDDDKQDETVMSFCELIFFQYAFAYFIDNIFRHFQNRLISDMLDVIKRRFNQVSNKKYSTFRGVHKFLLYFRINGYETSIERILNSFQFSGKTIIELLELLDEDYNYYFREGFVSYKLHLKVVKSNEGIYSKYFTKDSHRRFERLIKRENYPPLFLLY